MHMISTDGSFSGSENINIMVITCTVHVYVKGSTGMSVVLNDGCYLSYTACIEYE